MKKAINYPLLWQQKRNEWPVDGDPNADWLAMQAVLDNLMPVTVAVKKPYNPKGLKGLYKLLITFSGAIVIYCGVQLYLSKKQKETLKDIPQKNIPAMPSPVTKDNRIVTPLPGNSPLAKPNGNMGDNNAHIAGIGSKPGKTFNAVSKISREAPIEKETGNTKENSILHRDSDLLPVNPRMPQPLIDSVIEIKPSIPARLNSEATQKAAPGSARPLKKKRRSKIQIFL